MVYDLFNCEEKEDERAPLLNADNLPLHVAARAGTKNGLRKDPQVPGKQNSEQ